MPPLDELHHQPSLNHPEDGDPTDEKLMVRVRDQDDLGAFESLVRRYEKPLFRYLFRYLRNAELADEVFQNAFTRVHEKRDVYTEERKFRPWLYRIATNQAVDELRREGRHRAASLDQTVHCDPVGRNAARLIARRNAAARRTVGSRRMPDLDPHRHRRAARTFAGRRAGDLLSRLEISRGRRETRHPYRHGQIAIEHRADDAQRGVAEREDVAVTLRE